MISSWRRPALKSLPAAKAGELNLICTLAKKEALSGGYDDALMLDWREQIAETTGANIFFVIDGALHTPEADCFLNGITRQTVIEMARLRELDVVERIMTLADLAHATEVFLTGTASEIIPVRQINEHVFRPSEVTYALMDDYRRKVAESTDGSLSAFR